MLFDGVDDYIRIPDNPNARPRSLTISVWVKFCGLIPSIYSQDRMKVVLFKGNPTVPVSYGLMMTWGAGFPFILANIGGHHEEIASSPGNDGRWHHWVATFGDEGAGGIWIDGVNRNSPNRGSILLETSTGDWHVARNINTTAPSFTRIAIDDIRVYVRLLSDAEISTLYSENNWPSVTIPAPNLRVSIQAQGPTSICPGESVVLSAVSPGSPDLYTWQVANGMSARDTNNQSITVSPGATTYRVVTTFG